jgi:hypothetical protein
MRLVAPTDPSQHRPFHIGDGPSHSGPRIGGRAPTLDAMPALAPGSQYVLTIPFQVEPAVNVSVFVNGPIEALLKSMNDGLQSDDRIVAIRHGEVIRGDSDEFRSDLSAHPLVVAESLEPDLVKDSEGGRAISSHHKLGGRPYCIQEPDLEGAEELLGRGYVQALQLDFPGPGDGAVSGSWPFADGLFNLFIAPQRGVPLYWAFQK